MGRGILFLALVFSAWSSELHAQDLPFYENFDDGNFDGWEITNDPEPQSGPSQWEVANGELVQRSNVWSYADVDQETKYHLGTHVSSGNSEWADYSFNALVRSADNDGVGLIFRYQDAQNYYRILLMDDSAWSGRDSSGVAVNTPLQRIQKFVDGEPIILAENLVGEAYPSGYFALTADIRGDSIKAYLDGQLILQATDDQYSKGEVGMLSYANSGAFYDSLSVTSERLVYDKPVQQPITYPVNVFRAPYIQNPTQTSVEIAWRTTSEGIGRVRYGTEKGALTNEVIEDAATQKHHVHLEDLEPSTRYYYEVHQDGDEIHGEENFRTARNHDENEFSFLVLGDSGVNTDIQREVASEMRKSMNNEEVDFGVHVGDVHQGNGSEYDTIYFQPYMEILKNINFFTSLGNHDVITDNGGPYLDSFYLPHNNAESTERYYSFRWANAYFIALDTNIDYSPGSAQYQFFENALQDPMRESALWTFVYCHHPPFTEFWTNYYGDETVQNHLLPLYEQYNVDMVMNGHTHSYERGEKEHVHYLVSGGGGGGLDDFFVDYDHISFSAKEHHFTRVDVKDDQLWVTATNNKGLEIDRFLINKFVDVGVEDEAGGELPMGYAEGANHPNPFTTTTTLEYNIPRGVRVTMELFDVSGRRVTTLVDRFHEPNTYRLELDASRLSAGTYVATLTASDFVQSRKLTVVR